MRTRFSRIPKVEQLESREVLSSYYVSTTGLDTALGTSLTAAWRTLQHAVDHVKAGDIILVESGTYLGCRIGNSGTATAPITLEADKGAKVLVNKPGPKNYHGSDIEVENFGATVSYWKIIGLEVANAPTHAGIDIRNTSHISVSNCYCHNNYRWGIFLAFSDYPTLTGNHCSYSTTQHGIYDSNSGDYATVTGNICDHNHDCGIQFNGDVSQGGKGYMVGNLIAGNILHDNGAGGGAALNFDGLVNSTIENNLLYNNLAGGIVLYKSNAATGSTGNIVVNNTVIMPATARWAVNISNSSTGNKFYNNIFMELNSARGCIEIDSSSLSGFVSDNNIFGGGGSYLSVDGGTTRITLATWQTKTNKDKHSIAAALNSLFVNYATSDFHLSVTSPAINKGTATDAPSKDLDGANRPYGGAFDIGCYEYHGLKL
jgi:parallel beta-helix repeat protein